MQVIAIFLQKRKFMKYISIVFVLFLCGRLSAQTNNEAANNAMSSLTEQIEKAQMLDKIVTHNIYGNVSSYDISEYDKRLNKANEILDELNTIDKEFRDLAEHYPNEKNYLLYGVLTKLTILGITYNSGDYLNYLRLNKSSMRRYDEQKEAWDKKSSDNIKATKSLVNRYKQIGKDDAYTQTLYAISEYYDDKKSKAYSDLQSIVKGLQDKISAERDDVAENAVREKNLSFAMAWLGYLYHSDKKNDSALSVFRRVKEGINESDNGSLTWTERATKQINQAKSKSSDLDISSFNLPEANKFYDFKKLTYEKMGTAGFELKSESRQVISDQGQLIDGTMKNWEKFSVEDARPMNLVIDKMKARGGKLGKNDYPDVFQKMTSKNKGGGTHNLALYRQRFDEIYGVLQEFLFLRACWTNMIQSNPDVAFFRMYRIKTDLGIMYLNQNKYDYLVFFDYYKIHKKKIGDADLKSIRDDFAMDVQSEVNADISFCLSKEPDNLMYKLTGAEISVMTGTPAAAENALTAIEKQLAADPTVIDDVDPKSVIELYRSYLSLKTGDFNKFKQTINPLKMYQNTAYWSEEKKDYPYYFENVKTD